MVTMPSKYQRVREDNLTGGLGSHISDAHMLDHKYCLTDHPDFYFIIRKGAESDAVDFERVCLYRENVINIHLFGSNEPGTQLISNDPRGVSRIGAIYRNMAEKAEEYLASKRKNF